MSRRSISSTTLRAAAGVDFAAVLVVDELPVDVRHNSKIDRAEVRRWAADVLAGGGAGREGPRHRRHRPARRRRGAATARARGRRRHGAAGRGRRALASRCAATSGTRTPLPALLRCGRRGPPRGEGLGQRPLGGVRTVNVGGTENLLDAARAHGVRRLVHVSSPSVAHVGDPLVGCGADPADPARAHGHYARSKALAEQLALAADDDASRSWRCARTWSGARATPSSSDGSWSGRAPAGSSSSTAAAALIDTTYVDNAADALVAALDRVDDVHGEAFVVSNGEPRTVAELLARICRAAGVPEPTRSVPAPLASGAGVVVERAWALPPATTSRP